MFSDLDNLASSLLDEHIAKAFSKPSRKKDERQLIKSLSHDPFDPVLMTHESTYYNPYRAMPDGSFLPYPVSHWADQGKDPDGYGATQRFYDYYLPVKKSLETLKSFSKVVGSDLIKAGAVPIGTVHTYRDGGKYRKVAEGQWVPVSDQSDRMKTWMNHPNPEYRRQANQEIEKHGTQTVALEEMIAKRQREKAGQDDIRQQIAKEVAKNLKGIFEKMYDGKVPDNVAAHLDKIHGKEEKIDPKKAVSEVTNEVVKPKHNVTMKFMHNGKKYEHTFPNVEGSGHFDAIDKVSQALKKKLGGIQLLSANAQTVKQQAGGSANV